MAWWNYTPGRHTPSHLFSTGRKPFFFTPTRRHPRGIGGSHLPKHAAERNPLFGPKYSGRR